MYWTGDEPSPNVAPFRLLLSVGRQQHRQVFLLGDFLPAGMNRRRHE